VLRGVADTARVPTHRPLPAPLAGGRRRLTPHAVPRGG
jgi:hypothetical protein